MSFERACVEQALKKLLGADSFHITDLDAIGEMIGKNVRQHTNYKFLRSLHCVKYTEMPREIIDQLEARIIECLSGTLFNPTRVLDAVLDEGNDFAPTEDRYLNSTTKRLLQRC